MKQQHFWFTGDINVDWRLDEHTKTIGREGIAAARRRLMDSDGTPARQLQTAA